MIIKAGVDISRLNPEIRDVLYDAARICEYDKDEIVVTSTYEGNHREDSYHYSNDAFDFTGRYRLVPMWAFNLEERLPNDFDVVYEVDHIHVEHDRSKE